MDESKLNLISGILANSKHTVVVTGAGISTEAGIPDFRGKEGIYTKLGEDKVTSIINIQTFRKDPQLFYSFYRKYFTLPKVPPSKVHKILAQMEETGRIKAIVTQNVDGLHQKAGSQRVIAVHGTRSKYICTDQRCQKVYNADYVSEYPQTVPLCSECGSILKPDVVLFGEPIKQFIDAENAIMNASVLLVIGTSLAVYPLAGFVREFGVLYKNLIIINKGPTELDHEALIKLDVDNTGDTLEEINNRISSL